MVIHTEQPQRLSSSIQHWSDAVSQADRCVAESIQAFLQHYNADQDRPSTVTLFAESPCSPLAGAFLANIGEFAQESVQVRVVFATNDEALVAGYAAEIGKFRNDWAASVRRVKPRDYAGCNEQLVLGSWGYVSGPTISQVKRRPALDAAEVSTSSQEAAVAAFGFELLWRASLPIVGRSRPRQGQALFAELLSGLSAGPLGWLVFRISAGRQQ